MKKSNPQSKPSRTTKKPRRHRIVIPIIAIVLCTIACITLLYRYTHSKDYLTNRLRALSNHQSGESFNSFVTTIQKDMPDYEIIAVFDENGRKLIEYTEYQEAEVSLPSEANRLLRYFDDLTHVHTHPIGDAGHADGDLSMPNRIGLADQISAVVVVSENYTYYMERGDNAWPTHKEVMGYFMNYIYMYDSLQAIGFAETVIYNGEEQGIFTNACLEQFAKDFGYTFYVINTSQGTTSSP